MSTIGVWDKLACKCDRCGHAWIAEGEKPKRCAKCKSPAWDKVPNAQVNGGRKPGVADEVSGIPVASSVARRNAAVGKKANPATHAAVATCRHGKNKRQDCLECCSGFDNTEPRIEAAVAQTAEQPACTGKVESATPSGGSKIKTPAMVHRGRCPICNKPTVEWGSMRRCVPCGRNY